MKYGYFKPISTIPPVKSAGNSGINVLFTIMLSIIEVGKISIKSAWSVKKSDYIETGDLGYIDSDGLVYLKGRIDDMIVSGGENVYPLELENILNEHPNIKQSVVLGISDEEFGQRLKAFIDLKEGLTLSEKDLRNWLMERCTRYQMPKVIEFKEITFSELGKVNKTGI